MQGQKIYQEKLFVMFRLSDHVPLDNFYRRLKETLDLSFLRKQTREFYGTEGQKSIDPEVFFKLMLIGYLENINSDRRIIQTASLRLDMLYFLGYNIDEPLPWHSTLSRTRKLYSEEVFLSLFRSILYLCVEKGMVNGSRQAADSAYIKANASMESLIEKESTEYLHELKESEETEDENKRKNSKDWDNPDKTTQRSANRSKK